MKVTMANSGLKGLIVYSCLHFKHPFLGRMLTVSALTMHRRCRIWLGNYFGEKVLTSPDLTAIFQNLTGSVRN